MTDEATRTGKRNARVAEPDAPPARKIGRFVIDGVLGEGGMGVVLAAHDPDLDRKVAIKLLHDDEDGGDPTARTRLMREAQAMARLRHPNVVTVHEVGRHDGDVYVAMEYVPGGTLRMWLDGNASARWSDILDKFVPAGRGLASAHVAGLVHRDFKPDNVMVDDTGHVLVTDFGLADLHGEALVGGKVEISGESSLMTTLTSTGAVMGTPRFMAPEQHNAEPTDARTDQFSFCAALYAALYGVHPFAGESYEVIKLNALEGTLTPPKDDREVPPRIHDAVIRGLRPAPADRWPSMDALLEALEPPVAPAPAPPAPSRAPWIAIAAVPIIGLGVGIAVVSWPRDKADPLAAQKQVDRAAKACDCELVTVELPPGATLDAKVEATGQLLIAPGDQRIAYTVDGTGYVLALHGEGYGKARMIALPAPEHREGFVFVPGGDVSIGDASGAPDEAPVSRVHLAPYLIAIHEDVGEKSYADARARTRELHARLPTAAEWEWAARLGVIEGALSERWEWTGTRYAPYPYVDDGRDDAYADGDTAEARGGTVEPGETPRITRRLEARRAGAAELRVARTPSSVAPPRELVVRTGKITTRPSTGVRRTEYGVLPSEVVALHRFIEAWGALDDPPALQLVKPDPKAKVAWCPAYQALGALGVDAQRIELVAGTDERIVVRWNPVPGYRGKTTMCMTEAIEEVVFEPICFDDDVLLKGSGPSIDHVAEQLLADPSFQVIVHSYVPRGTFQPQELSEIRADIVLDALESRGVDDKRITAIGHGDTVPTADVETVDAGLARDKRLLLGDALEEPCPGGVDDRIELELVTP